MKHLIVISFFIFLIFKSNAQPGTLDQTFNNIGKVIGIGLGEGDDVVLQKDGKIICSISPFSFSGFLIARYLGDGNLDSTFGKNGMVSTVNGNIMKTNIAVQSDKKIIAVGTTNTGSVPDFAIILCRYKENGTVDSGFGQNGQVTTKLKNEIYNSDIALQPDGKIVISGTATNYYSGENAPQGILTMRYTVDGRLDSSFGDGGAIVTLTGFQEEGTSITVQKDGKIITGGYAGYSSGTSDRKSFVLIRHLPDGTPDPDFGDNGIVIQNYLEGGGHDYLYDIALQDNGKIVAVGEHAEDKSFLLIRFNDDGNLDESFGKGGKVLTIFKGQNSKCLAVDIQTNDKIVATGSTYPNGGFSDFLLTRYLYTGIVDSTFGENGRVVTDFGLSDIAKSLVIQPDGMILVAGRANSALQYNFALARYNGDPFNQHPLITKIKKWIRNHILNFQDTNPNAVYYVIEKSTASNTGFVPVTKITANAATTNYSYTLPETTTQSTYRIKAVNKDNSINYSSPISSSDPAKAGVASFKVYPNPAKDRITVETIGMVQLRLQNSNGRVLLTQMVNGKGIIDISKLPVGVYYVVNTLNGESLKVVKE